MNRNQLLTTFSVERARLTGLLDDVGPERMDTPGVSGRYSVKDIIAHLTAYQAALARWLREAQAGRVWVDDLLDDPDLEARNAAVYEANKDRRTTQVLKEFGAALDELEMAVSDLSDEALDDPERTAWFVEPRWGQPKALWRCIADDSFAHHVQHIPDIERWIVEHGPAGDM